MILCLDRSLIIDDYPSLCFFYCLIGDLGFSVIALIYLITYCRIKVKTKTGILINMGGGVSTGRDCLGFCGLEQIVIDLADFTWYNPFKIIFDIDDIDDPDPAI